MCSSVLNKPWGFLIFCCHGVFASFVCVCVCFSFSSSCLHSLSIQVWHLYFAHAGFISVCTLSVGWGWLGELPLHTFITFTDFMLLLQSCRWKGVREKQSMCGISMQLNCVVFIWLGCNPSLSSVIIFLFSSSFFGGWFTIHPGCLLLLLLVCFGSNQLVFFLYLS